MATGDKETYARGEEMCKVGALAVAREADQHRL